ncbi:MAG: VWA domain-containing protein [Acidobacteria bacterium]|nr:VWA domain-containing protein [Acidobacteriota bacterium]
MNFYNIHFAALLLIAFPIAAQDESLPDLFSDVMDVRVVNLEVVVTDRKGNRIRGLEASDFELLVDRKPLPIAYFTEVDEGYARSSIDDQVPAATALAADEPVGTNYLIFIDDLHAQGHQRDRVLSRLEGELTVLNPADRVAIVAFDGRDVSLLADWTNSRPRINRALVQARQRKAHGRARQLDLGSGSQPTRRTVMAAAATIRSFADAPGRKVMLLLAQDWSAPNSFRTTQASMQSLYGPLVHAANRVGYSLYPIDLPGLRPSPRTREFIGLDLGSSRPGGHQYFSTGDSRGSNIVTYPGPYLSRSDQISYGLWYTETREHDVLVFLASQTGGKAMLNSYRDRALSETADDTRSYYWLGFEPPRAEADELHRIKVRLAGHRGLRIRARKHYLDMSRGTELSMLLEGSLLFGGSPGKGSLEVRFGTPRKAGFLRVAVPMTVEIPLDDLELLPMDGRWMNEVELRVTTLSERGRLSPLPVRKIPVLRPEAPAPGETFIYETDLRLRRRSHRYVAAVYDPLTGTILSTEGTVDPEDRVNGR